MRKSSYHFLRVGLAITFLWIGILILRDPQAWGSYIQPWALKFLPIPLEQAMRSTAILDIVVGLGFLFDFLPWVAALLGSVHLIVILITSGVTDITIRDVGLLTGTLALLIESSPLWLRNKFVKGADAM